MEFVLELQELGDPAIIEFGIAASDASMADCGLDSALSGTSCVGDCAYVTAD